MAYSTRANVYALGLSPEAFARSPRLIERVVIASGLLFLRSHGLSTDDPITLSIQSEATLGAPAAALPGGLVEGPYFAQPANSDSFRVSLTAGGSAISSFSTSGSGVFGIVVDHGVYLDAAIAAADTIIDAYAIAHKSPLQAAVLPIVSSFLAARIYVAAHAFGNPTFAKMTEPPEWLKGLIDRLFSLWLSGAPLPAGSSDATPNVVENGAVLVPLLGRDLHDEEEEQRV